MPDAPSARRVFARLKPVDAETVAFETSFSPRLFHAFKTRIPAGRRRWDRAHRRWLVDASEAERCAALAELILGVRPDLPGAAPPAPSETRLIQVEYLGRCKPRDGGESRATAWADGWWSVVFPEDVLREWFEPGPEDADPTVDVFATGAGTSTSATTRAAGGSARRSTQPASRPQPPRTLYALLGLRPSATADEVKAAYRRLAKQWHPDVCAEPDATERFKTLGAAYEVLKDEALRRRYDAGLALEAHARALDPATANHPTQDAYSAPLRCGWVRCEGRVKLGQFAVSRIEQWEPITDEWGRELVTSWPPGARHFVSQWVAP
jgi:hypothetical protein